MKTEKKIFRLIGNVIHDSEVDLYAPLITNHSEKWAFSSNDDSNKKLEIVKLILRSDTKFTQSENGLEKFSVHQTGEPPYDYPVYFIKYQPNKKSNNLGEKVTFLAVPYAAMARSIFNELTELWKSHKLLFQHIDLKVLTDYTHDSQFTVSKIEFRVDGDKPNLDTIKTSISNPRHGGNILYSSFFKYGLAYLSEIYGVNSIIKSCSLVSKNNLSIALKIDNRGNIGYSTFIDEPDFSGIESFLDLIYSNADLVKDSTTPPYMGVKLNVNGIEGN